MSTSKQQGKRHGDGLPEEKQKKLKGMPARSSSPVCGTLAPVPDDCHEDAAVCYPSKAFDPIVTFKVHEPEPTPLVNDELNKRELYDHLVSTHFGTTLADADGKEVFYICVVFAIQRDPDEASEKRTFYFPKPLMDKVYSEGKVIEFNGIALPEESALWKYFTAENNDKLTTAFDALSADSAALVRTAVGIIPNSDLMGNPLLMRPYFRIEMQQD
jgi:hypothetical protein